jgi:acyl-CoA thioester hydrolase
MTTPARIPLDLRWRDLDAFGHLNNASTVSLFEEGRIRWLTQLLPEWGELDSAPVLAAITVNYRQPVHYPQALVVELQATRIGSSSVTLGQRLLTAAGAVHADGEVVLVWVERASGKPSPLPPILRQRFEATQAG